MGRIYITNKLRRKIKMNLRLTNSDKCELLNIVPEELSNEIQNEIFFKEMYLVQNEELHMIEKAICDSIELEIDTEIPEDDNTRLSFYALNNELVVIRRKKINIKLFFELLIDLFSFSTGSNVTKIGAVLNIFLKTFLNVLDEDVALVYAFISNQYFKKGRQYNNVEIFDAVNKYLMEVLQMGWSADKINKILLQLESLQVIEFNNGLLKVNDKIYF